MAFICVAGRGLLTFGPPRLVLYAGYGQELPDRGVLSRRGQNQMYRPNSFYLVSIVWGIMIGAVLACSAGSQGGSGGGDTATEPPAEAVTSESSGGAAAVDPLETVDP